VSKITIIIPCYNEAERLDTAVFLSWVKEVEVSLIFVNDGSTDGTEDVLRALCEQAALGMSYFSLDKNSGKAEAVRRGLEHALAEDADIVGYLDADLATSLTEAETIVEQLITSDRKVAMGARVALADRDIQRGLMRHYLGRAFATFASSGLRATFYDTQCGAKFFKASEHLSQVLKDPFETRWVFDVELLWRLLYGPYDSPSYTRHDFMEVPLKSWKDQAGSKINMGQTASIVADCCRLLALFAKVKQ